MSNSRPVGVAGVGQSLETRLDADGGVAKRRDRGALLKPDRRMNKRQMRLFAIASTGNAAVVFLGLRSTAIANFHA